MYQVGLELGEVDIECAVETEGRGDGRDNLAHQAIQISVSWPIDVQVPADEIKIQSHALLHYAQLKNI